MKMLELNQVLLEGERQTLSLMAFAGEVTTLTGGSAEHLSRWLAAVMGFATVLNGYISIDGEPLSSRSAPVFRRLMAYAPARLVRLGEVKFYEPPTVQDIFGLQVNRELPISNGILGEEIRKIGVDPSDERVQLIAVASLLNKPVLLIDNPPVGAMGYLRQLAVKGRVVLLTSNEREVLAASDKVVEV